MVKRKINNWLLSRDIQVVLTDLLTKKKNDQCMQVDNQEKESENSIIIAMLYYMNYKN